MDPVADHQRIQVPDMAYTSLLTLWHEYRFPILILAISALAIVRILASRKSSQQLASSKLASLDAAKREPAILTNPIKSFPKAKSTERVPKRAIGQKYKSNVTQNTHVDQPLQIQPIIFYFSLAGATEQFASQALERLESKIGANGWLKPVVHDLSSIDYDDFFVDGPKTIDQNTPSQAFYLILLPSYEIDTEINNFIQHLVETHNDFRIDTGSLSNLAGYSVFGFGDREGWPTEEQGFCFQAKKVDAWMARLTGRKRGYPLGLTEVKSGAKSALDEWIDGVAEVLVDLAAGKGLGQGVSGSGDALESDEESDKEEELAQGASTESKTNPKKARSKRSPKSTMPDLEDLGGRGAPLAVDFTTYDSGKQPSSVMSDRPQMVPKTSPTHAALTKQGYTIVGSHSGVKICRWTKSALRGRGSCYKFSFYGIRSHLCMETTPSLSCSNKCVFCWRKSTNPVGTTWKWQVDPPDMIFAGVKEGHYKKIKMMKGVPGVRADRFAEAMRIRHCALSLVGEPIFYPHINEFTAMLHKERISSFLVCNAQHPDQLATLRPVTQLYVSIDASNKESLRKIDRPLHRDFWERFCRCLDILREKRFTQRTVFRLTLVKGFNIDEEAEGYADLVEKALPGFVEVKGVTYCGTSTSSSAGLTMENVPFYAEVCGFVEALTAALQRRGLDYGISAEHAHSCCILIADRKRFYKEDGWHTLIDYEKFFDCLESGKTFAPEDYIGEKTPDWATYGSESGGFNPADERVDRKGRPKEDVEIIRS